MPISRFRPLGRRVSGRFLGRALLIATIVALPFGCDDDGTSPPDPDADELPDTLSSGTYEVADLHVEQGDTFTIEGDVVIEASGPVRIDGAINVLPGASFAVASQDSLVISGFVGPDTLAEPIAAAAAAARGGVAEDVQTPVRLAGEHVVVRDWGVSGDPLEIATMGAGTVHIAVFVSATTGVAGTRDTPGGPGGAIHIGDAVANSAWPDRAERPDLIVFTGAIRGGGGGKGFVDEEGILVGRDRIAVGTDGGRGGDVFVAAREIRILHDGISAGKGGEGGYCGDHNSVVSALDGSAPGEKGGDFDCRTGSGGDGGDAIVTATIIENGDFVRGGFAGRGGLAEGRAGNGGPGANGGNVSVEFGLRGLPGAPNAPDVIDGMWVTVHSGGSGGAADRAGMAGGAGGNVSLLEVGGNRVDTFTRLIIRPAVANGGAGFSGCSTDPFTAGSPAGPAGNVVTKGAPLELVGAGFAGGDGADGRAPSIGASGGHDDSGNRLGPDGGSGTPCNDPASVLSVDASEDILAEVEFVVLEFNANNLAAGNCEIRVNDEPVEGECTSSNSATATAPAAVLKPGPNSACIENGGPGGGVGDCGEFLMLVPSPFISAINPTSVMRGAAPVALAVEGGNFGPGAALLVNGEPRTTVRVDQGRLEGQLTETDVAQAGTLSLSVRVDFGAADAEPVALDVVNATPILDVITPDAVPNENRAGTFGMHMYGWNFVEGGVAVFNGATYPVIYHDVGHVLALIPFEELKTIGEYPVYYRNPGPGMPASGTQTLRVYGAATLHPYIADPVVEVGEEDARPLVVIEGYYDADSYFLLDGQRVEFVQEEGFPGIVRVVLPPELIDEAGSYTLELWNGIRSTNSLVVTVQHPAPILDSIEPTAVPNENRSGTLGLDMYGSNFVPGGVAWFNGTFYPVNYVDAGHVVALIPYEDLKVVGEYPVSYENPGPSAGPSATRTLQVYGAATIQGYVEDVVVTAREDAAPLIIITGYYDADSYFLFDGERVELVQEPDFPGIVRVHIPAELLPRGGEFQLELWNGIRSTNSLTVTVENPVPVFITTDPSDAVVGSPTMAVTIHGLDFVPESVVWFGGVPYETTVLSDGAAVITVDAAVFAEPGNLPVWVENPFGGTSNIGSFIIKEPVTVIGTDVTSLTRGSTGNFIHVYVEGVYTPSAQVRIDGAIVPTSHVAPGVFQIEVYDDFLLETGTLSITVNDFEIESVNAAEVTVVNPPVVIQDVSPDGAIAGAGDYQLTVSGTGLFHDTEATFAGSPLEFVAVGIDFIVYEVPAAQVAVAGEGLLELGNDGVESPNGEWTLYIIDADPTITSLDPANVPVGFSGTMGVQGTNFMDGVEAWYQFGAQAPEQLELQRTSDAFLEVLLAPTHTTAAGPATLVLRNPLDAVPADWPRPAGPFESSPFAFAVQDAMDPCTQVHPLALGTPVTSTFTAADCTRGSGSVTWRERTYEVTTAGAPVELVFNAAPRGTVRIRSGGVRSDYIFSFGTATTRDIFLPAGTHQVIVETATGSSPDVTFTLDAHSAPAASIGPCSVSALGRPGFELHDQMLESTDCVGINRFDPNAGSSRYDPVALAVANGEHVRIVMQSDAFQPVPQLICSGPCPTARIEGTPMSIDGVRAGVIDFIIDSGSGAQWRVEFNSEGSTYGEYLGTYDARVELNPAPVAFDRCNPFEPGLPLAPYGAARPFALANTDCLVPGSAPQNYFELFAVTTENVATQLDLMSDGPGEFYIWQDGDLVGQYSSTFRTVFYPAGRYVVQPTTVAGFVPLDGTMNIGPAGSAELLHCPVRAGFWPGAVTMQTLSDGFEDTSCSVGNVDGDERRYDGYDIRIPPGRTIRITMSSGAIDPVLYFRIPGAGIDLSDDDSGGGTTAVITYTNATSAPQRAEFDASTPFVDVTDPAGNGVYQIGVDWVE